MKTNNDYKNRAVQIIADMTMLLANCETEDKYIQKNIKRIKKFIDCMDLVDNFKKIVEEKEENEVQ